MAAAELREEIRAGGLLAPGRRVLVMLSGGRDSTCLLDLAVALCGAAQVSALHVNYGLRESADADERHCRALCRGLAVELEVMRAEREPALAGSQGNLQAWAREVRYEAAERIAAPLDALIATGHTASDQVETILYRLAASPGRRALLGMPAAEGRLVRPLLGVTREQSTAYCEARGLRWREDESNLDERYARTRVRHGLLEALRAVHPAAESNVLRTAELLREETQLLEELVARELQAGGPRVELARLAEMAPALARLVVVGLAERAAGGYIPQAGDRVGEILALGSRPGSVQLHVGGLAAAVVHDGVLEMVKLAPRGERPPEH
ncbi:MAG: tRNA(Ile)-lysidine synthase [Solirubrobacteraceae bacterium]|jgi:tRNA(Ile)-lysidine synthase|nr:tRNA(Ile)-lysidine synthase [Solirubrobacteraceae bacterium]